MAKHLEGSVWGLRWPPKKRPNGAVRTHNKKSLVISVEGVHAFEGTRELGVMIVDRTTARLLAKRILDALEYTK